MYLNGHKYAEEIYDQLIVPPKLHLAAFCIGDDPASKIYLARKQKMCERLNIRFSLYAYPHDTPVETVRAAILQCNNDPATHGIFLQKPLPPIFSAAHLENSIEPKKDVDGLTTINMGLLLQENPYHVPCTPLGILYLLQRLGSVQVGQHVVIVGRSAIVGRPLSILLSQNSMRGNATVTLAHSRSKDLSTLCRSADILISATGIPHLLQKDAVKEGAVVIDVGICRKDGQLVGDVATAEVAPHVHAITPVPGGVGPMTIAMLMHNLVQAYRLCSGD